MGGDIVSTVVIKAYIRKNKGKCIRITCVCLVLTLALCLFLTNNLTKTREIEVADNPIQETEVILVPEVEKEVFIIADIQGAVNDPGVKKLPEGARVNDAVTEAGGLTEKAYTMDVNLAAKLTDGDKVYIPVENEKVSNEKTTGREMAGIVTQPTSGSSSGSGTETGSIVNINTASFEQLQTLSGVGPATAQKIIDYREKNAGFKKTEDIMKVSGIGIKTFEKLKDKIAV